MYSLRRALAWRFAITIFIALSFISFWAYLGTRRVLREELDKGLASAARLETAGLATGEVIPTHQGAASKEHFVSSVNRFVAVRDSAGRVLATNTALAADLPVDLESLRRARAGEQVWVTQQWNGHAIRSVYVRPERALLGDIVVQVGASLAPLRASTREILLLMTGTVLLGTAVTAIGAAWLARSATAPVSTIVAQAEAIAPDTTGHRISAFSNITEFNGLVRVLNSMLDRLDRVFQSQRRIIADVGHELRTPLTAMQGELEVALRTSRRPDDYQVLLRSILEEVHHLDSISESLILLARIEGDALELKPADVELNTLIDNAVEGTRSRAGNRTFQTTRQPEALKIHIDERMIGLVLDHLLLNVVQHTPPGTRAVVSTSADDHAVTIAVDDDGPGVPPDVLPHLLDRFYRADSARTRKAGAGLGLTIAAAIAHAHHGTIRTERSPMGGLKVAVRLPRDCGGSMNR